MLGRGMKLLMIKQKKSKQDFFRKIKRHSPFYWMLLPCIVSFLIFSYLPMAGMVLAFKEFKFNAGLFGGDWVGLKYFARFFQDSQNWLYLRNTVIISSLKLFLAMPLPILLALLFNEVKNSKIRSFFQSISYIPHFISWVVVVGILQRILAPDTGLLNQILHAMGQDGSTFFMMKESYFYPIMFWSYVWKDIGWSSIVYFAAIMGINPELYEAAEIDGAGKLSQIWYITLAGIRPTVLILFILSLGNILYAGYDQIYLLKTPGNAALSEVIDTYIIRMGLQGGDFGYATAMGMMQGVIGLILVLIVNRITKKLFDTSVW